MHSPHASITAEYKDLPDRRHPYPSILPFRNGKDSVRHVISPSQVRPAAPQFIWHDIGYEEYGFKEKHYLIPYSSSELRSNPNLKQNPGW